MTIYQKICITILTTGLGMFLTGVLIFSHGEEISMVLQKIGEYSFLCGLPTIIIGIILVFVLKSKNLMFYKAGHSKQL